MSGQAAVFFHGIDFGLFHPEETALAGSGDSSSENIEAAPAEGLFEKRHVVKGQPQRARLVPCVHAENIQISHPFLACNAPYHPVDGTHLPRRRLADLLRFPESVIIPGIGIHQISHGPDIQFFKKLLRLLPHALQPCNGSIPVHNRTSLKQRRQQTLPPPLFVTYSTDIM